MTSKNRVKLFHFATYSKKVIRAALSQVWIKCTFRIV